MFLSDENDYKKNRNYWKYLKVKLKKESNELVSAANQLKLTAAIQTPWRVADLDVFTAFPWLRGQVGCKLQYSEEIR